LEEREDVNGPASTRSPSARWKSFTTPWFASSRAGDQSIIGLGARKVMAGMGRTPALLCRQPNGRRWGMKTSSRGAGWTSAICSV